MANKLRRYWDSACCFGHLMDQAGRAAECERVLEDAATGKCEIVVSALIIAEVLHLKSAKRSVPQEARDKIRKFFRRSYIIVADVDRFIAERAQDLFWEHNIMPKDAVHVATALTAEAHFLETFDDLLLEKSRQVGGDPQLVIQRPGADILRAEAQGRRPRPQTSLDLPDGLPGAGPLSS